MAYTIENVDWARDKHRLKAIREDVFVLEWRVPQDSEFDERDASAFHVLLLEDGEEANQPIATGRLTQCGEIGRIAVKRGYRNMSVYRALFAALIEVANRHNVTILKVSCSLDSVSYHQGLGFKPEGQVFMDGGVARQRMQCPVERFPFPDDSQMH